MEMWPRDASHLEMFASFMSDRYLFYRPGLNADCCVSAKVGYVPQYLICASCKFSQCMKFLFLSLLGWSLLPNALRSFEDLLCFSELRYY